MKSIVSLFLKRPALINFILLFLIIAGTVAILNVKREVFPLAEMDTVVIHVAYPGASPADVELNAIVPIERELKSIRGISEYTSYSIEDGGTVYASLDPEINDKKSVKDEIFRTITISNIEDLSDDVEEIRIVDLNPKLMAVTNIAVTATDDSFPRKKLYDTADTLEKKLLKIEGVTEIRKSGYTEREIQIAVDPLKSRKQFISLDEIVNSIKSRNIRESGGTIQSVKKEENIVTIGQFTDCSEVGNVIIRSNFAANNVTIKDVAEVVDTFKEQNTRVKVNGRQSVMLAVVKNESADVVDTIRRVKEYIHTSGINENTEADIAIVDDKSQSINALLGVVLSNALIGFALVFLILLVFFDIRTSFWTAFGIPVTLLMVISCMYVTDLSINMISLGAIITVLGMLVDHGIVMADIVHQNSAREGDTIERVSSAVTSILKPVLITILTTIAAFLPMLLVKGMMGKFIYIFPIIIAATLIASFIEAVFILPSHLAHGKTVKPKHWFVWLTKKYTRFLHRVLRYRYGVAVLFVLVLLLVLSLSGKTVSNYVLLWDDSADGLFINLETPDGTPLDETERQTMKLLPEIRKIIKPEELQFITTNIGHHTVKRSTSKGNHENWSQHLIFLVPRSERSRSAREIIAELQKRINTKTTSGFQRIQYKERVIGPTPGEAFDLKITEEDDPEEASALLGEVTSFLKSVEGVKGISTDRQRGNDQISVHLDYEKLAAYGMDVATVSRTIKTAYTGIVASSIQTPQSRLDFRVKMDDSYQRDKAFLKGLLIPNGLGALVRLDEIASFSKTSGKAVINHYNGERVITVTAGVDTDTITAMQLTQLVKKKFSDYKTTYPNTDLVYGGEVRETREATGNLGAAFLVALLFIYFLLFLLFNSTTQPFIVLLSIPFGITGALFAFTLHGIPLSFMGIVGIIGLCGVVVNDSVIMVDFINKENAGTGAGITSEAIINGAGRRLRPVLLTTMTTVAGLMPTVYGIGGNAQSLVPVVMAMAYGLLFATTITLILIPVIFQINNDIRKLIWRRL